MCGIFGVITKKETQHNPKSIKSILTDLARFSESRGKDSSGLAILHSTENVINVVKGNVRINDLLKENITSNLISNTFCEGFIYNNNTLAFGHARLVTDGSQLKEFNNQPVVKDDIVLIHNGIIVNVNEIWNAYPNLKREFQIDTEIINSLLSENLSQFNSVNEAVEQTLSSLKGTFSIASYFSKLNTFLLATNNGSLYYVTDNQSYLFFASEAHYFNELSKNTSFQKIAPDFQINQVGLNQRIWINLEDFQILNLQENHIQVQNLSTIAIQKQLIANQKYKKELVIDPTMFINRNEESQLFNSLQYNIEDIGQLKRCTKCILPETFPYIFFDQNGVCNYCNNYVIKNQEKSNTLLLDLIKPYQVKGNKPNCLVPFSGGRDSTYALHYIKKELGLNPIAFTYDWGMVTDLARRNAARVCGKLGVENIIVAADIELKRKNIKKNVLAWLNKPHLGMVPLFMAGDKYFFYYSNKVLEQTGLDLSIWGSNPLENTDFKAGFTGVKPKFDKKRIDEIQLLSKFKLASFFGKEFVTNPSYINTSLFDTFGSFISRYVTKRNGYIQLFDFLRWEETVIDELIINEYDWEKSIDTKSTWRIGDGTAAFYNYIYFTVAGFSEFDTFRSNQIREGQMTREEALKIVSEENLPRYENLRWYLKIIDVDFDSAIKTINNIPKLYSKL